MKESKSANINEPDGVIKHPVGRAELGKFYARPISWLAVILPLLILSVPSAIMAAEREKSIAEGVSAQLKDREEAQGLLEAMCGGVPENLMTLTLQKREPTVLDTHGDAVQVRWVFNASYNLNKYRNDFLPKAEKVLNQFARKTGNFATQAEASKYYSKSPTSAPIWSDKHVVQPLLHYEHGKDLIVFLNIGGSPRGDNLRWNYYIVDKSIFGPALSKVYSSWLDLQVNLVGSNSTVLRQQVVSLRFCRGGARGAESIYKHKGETDKIVHVGWRHFPAFVVPQFPLEVKQGVVSLLVLDATGDTYRETVPEQAADQFDAYSVSPLIKFDAPGCADNCYTSLIEIPVTMNLSLDELKQVVDLRPTFVRQQAEDWDTAHGLNNRR